MADSQSVKVVEVCRVAPPPDSAAPTSLPLTFLDILWLRFHPVERLFFYEISSSFFDAIIPNLKNSLSLTLANYLPLAGNLVWPEHSHKPIVEFLQGDGVLLTIAESDADFHHLSGDGIRKATEFHPLVPELPATHDRVEVISLQITLFHNGFSIGITSHHAILDGRTSTSFMKSWARVCNLIVAGETYSPATELAPFYDRTVVNDPVGLERLYLKEWQSIEGPNNRSLKFWSFKAPSDSIRRTFKLSLHDIQKLKQWVLKNSNHKPIHISTFTVAAAYVYVCVAKADGLADGKMIFGYTMDVRPRLDPPLPMNYFGNCVVGGCAIVEKKEILGENGVLFAVQMISDDIKRLIRDGVLTDAENWISLMRSVSEGEKVVAVAGSPRFEVYGADFGWGKPRKVEMISIDRTGALCLSDSRDGDGVEFGWAAERSMFERFAAHFAQGLESL